ncbi:MAG: NUDIX domain-containing protein [Novosphingobium sp.]
MIAALPAPVHRLALRIAHRLRLMWWSVRRPDLHGCNVIARNRDGAVLLVRHSYQGRDRWMLPGGGIGRGEAAEDAARREMREETGCRIEHPVAFAVEIHDLAGARNHVHLVAAVTDDPPVPDGREVVAARFFALDALPESMTRSTRRWIERWQAFAAQASGSSS